MIVLVVIVFSFVFLGISFLALKMIWRGYKAVNLNFKIDEDDDVEEQKARIERDTRINIILHFLLVLFTIKNFFIQKWSAPKPVGFYVDYMYNGIQFQLMSAVLFVVLSIINPFIIFPDEINKELKDKFLFFRHVYNNSKESFYIQKLVTIFTLLC